MTKVTPKIHFIVSNTLTPLYTKYLKRKKVTKVTKVTIIYCLFVTIGNLTKKNAFSVYL